MSAEYLTIRAIADRPELRDELHDASRAGHLILIAAGKAAGAMVRGFTTRGLTPARGTIATAHLDAGVDTTHLRVFLAGHPMPTAQSVEAGRHALTLAREARPDDRIVLLLSGGASALFAAPAAGLTLDDKSAATRALLASGAAIHDLNAVRKHLSAIKGGRLAAAAGCPVHTFAVSDVISPIDDDPGVIGSGPTVADETTFADALAAIDRLGARDAMPRVVMDLLERGAAGDEDESPKPGDPRLARADYTVIGSRRDAMAAARVEAERLGYTTFVLDDAIAGEARDAAPRLFARACSLANVDLARDRYALPLEVLSAAMEPPDADERACCIIASGETTVRVTGSGRGGRNQEFALALAEPLGAVVSPSIVAASVGTDGIDGPTDAAGALVASDTLSRARALGLDVPRAFLANNDAYRFFDALGDLIKTGPTDTNVGDLQIILIGR